MPLHPLLLPQPFSLLSLAFPAPTSPKRNMSRTFSLQLILHLESIHNNIKPLNSEKIMLSLKLIKQKKTEKPKNSLKIGRTFSFDICWSQARWLIKYPLAAKACMQACLVDTSWHLSRFHFEAAVWIGKPCLMSLCIILCGSSLPAFCSYFRTGSKHRHRFPQIQFQWRITCIIYHFHSLSAFGQHPKNEKHLMTWHPEHPKKSPERPASGPVRHLRHGFFLKALKKGVDHLLLGTFLTVATCFLKVAKWQTANLVRRFSIGFLSGIPGLLNTTINRSFGCTGWEMDDLLSQRTMK